MDITTVIIDRTVDARLRYEVVPDVHDAAVEVADLGGVRTEGDSAQGNGESEGVEASLHRVFSLVVTFHVYLASYFPL